MMTVVRCSDRMVFEIDPITFDAKHCSRYDAYCYTDPSPNVNYIEYSEWIVVVNKRRDEQMYKYDQERE